MDRDRYDDDREYRPRPKSGSGLKIFLIVGGILFAVLIACGGLGVFGLISMRGAANRAKGANDLKQIALGAHNYHDNQNGFPRDSVSPDGKPLLSWRVHLLPYVEQDNLYQQFNLDEPWDSPVNRRLMNEIPRIYVAPDAPPESAKAGKTHYRGFTGPGMAFGPAPPTRQPPLDKRDLMRIPVGPRLGEMNDGSAMTLLVVEAGDPVEWTKPGDLDLSDGKPIPAFGIRAKDSRVQVVTVDGRVLSVKKSQTDAAWRSAVLHSDGVSADAVLIKD